MSETMPQAAAHTIALDQISVQPDFNPRHHRTEDGMTALTESVAQRGVIQPILIRPNGQGGYYVVAGERRYRAATAAKLDTIAAVVRDLSDAEALALAVAENDKRENITAAEEARLAKRGLAQCDGEHDNAAVLLGWTRRKLDARLLLMHATDAVLDALEQRKISNGIAQLLASIPGVSQDGTLTHVIDNLEGDQLVFDVIKPEGKTKG